MHQHYLDAINLEARAVGLDTEKFQHQANEQRAKGNELRAFLVVLERFASESYVFHKIKPII